jgi:uncharacterized protein (TIGR03089 family)
MSASFTFSPLPGLVRQRLSAARDLPFLTFYDDATGERTELSHATLANWVAKTTNLLLEEYEVAPGDRVVLALPTHWTTAVIALACWAARAAVVVADQDAPGTALAALGAPALVVEAEQQVAGPRAPAGAPRMVVGAGLAGRLAGERPPGALVYGEEVGAHGDDLEDTGPAADDDALLHLPGGGGPPVRLVQRNLFAAAAAVAAWGLAPDARVLSTRSLRSVDGLVLGVLGAYVAGGSVVMVHRPDPRALGRRIRDERVTAVLAGGEDLAALPPAEDVRLRAVLCPAGASRAEQAQAQARAGVAVSVGHGLVAATCASSFTPPAPDPAVQAWLTRSAAPSVGVASAQAEVAVLGPGGAPVAEGQRGEVCVRGPVVTPDAGAWLHSGDEGFWETGPDGLAYVFLTGAV